MRVRPEHWTMLVDMGESNPQLITNKFNGPDGKARGHALWQTVAHQLNSMGFGEKSKEEWRKAFIDWKSKTKAKAARIKQELKKTGGGSAIYVPLSEIEKRLLGLMGTTAIDGDNVAELGFGEVTSQISTEITPQTDNCPELEHNYCEVSTPSTSRETTDTYYKPSVKRSGVLSEQNPRENPRKRSRTMVRKISSERLTEMTRESILVLKNIEENTRSLSESLQTIASVMKHHFGDNN